MDAEVFCSSHSCVKKLDCDGLHGRVQGAVMGQDDVGDACRIEAGLKPAITRHGNRGDRLLSP